MAIETIKECVKLIDEVKNEEVKKILINYLATICTKEGIVTPKESNKPPFKPVSYPQS
jgi:hypothetical protein